MIHADAPTDDSPAARGSTPPPAPSKPGGAYRYGLLAGLILGIVVTVILLDRPAPSTDAGGAP